MATQQELETRIQDLDRQIVELKAAKQETRDRLNEVLMKQSTQARLADLSDEEKQALLAELTGGQ